MNRSNVGNIVTNGMQILSVGATTAARTLGRADSALNNLSKEEKKEYYQMQADKMRDETKQYYDKSDSAFHNLSEEEQVQYRQFQADKMRKQMSDSEDDVDTLMADAPSSNSPQSPELTKKIIGDIEWTRKWTGRNIKTNRFVASRDNIEDLEKEGGNK